MRRTNLQPQRLISVATYKAKTCRGRGCPSTEYLQGCIYIHSRPSTHLFQVAFAHANIVGTSPTARQRLHTAGGSMLIDFPSSPDLVCCIIRPGALASTNCSTCSISMSPPRLLQLCKNDLWKLGVAESKQLKVRPHSCKKCDLASYASMRLTPQQLARDMQLLERTNCLSRASLQ